MSKLSDADDGWVVITQYPSS